MTIVEAAKSAQGPLRRSALMRLLLAGCGVLVLAGLSLFGWTWRHPSALPDYGGWGISNYHWRVGRTAYIAMTFPDHKATGWVQIHGVAPHGLIDSTAARFTYIICTPNLGPRGLAVGFASDSDFSKECGRQVPAVDAKLWLAKQQLIVAITPTRQGVITLRGIDLRYSDGWQNGTQWVGGKARFGVPNPG